jgi:hypothetical protein
MPWGALRILRVPAGSKPASLGPGAGKFIAESADSVDKEMSQYSGGRMKKLAVVFLTLAGALAVAPVASADSFTFNFSGAVNTTFGSNPGTISFSSVFITGVAATDGGFNITSVSGTYTDTSDGLTGNLSLYGGNGTNESPLTDTFDTESYDNVFYPNNNAPSDPSGPKGYVGGYFDDQGLLMTLTDGSSLYEVEFYGDATATDYFVQESIQGCNPATANTQQNQDACFLNESTGTSQLYEPGPGQLSSTPEPSSLLLLGTGLLGLAFIAYRKQLKSAL